MSRYYVLAGKYNIRTGEAPKIRAFTSKQKARAYAIVVMNRLGEKSWGVYSDPKCTKIMYDVKKSKNGYMLEDWQRPYEFGMMDLILHKDGSVSKPTFNTGKPYWGYTKQRSDKYTYLIQSDLGSSSKAKTVMAANIDELRKKLCQGKITRDGLYVKRITDNGITLLGRLWKSGDYYWDSFSNKNGWTTTYRVAAPSGRTY